MPYSHICTVTIKSLHYHNDTSLIVNETECTQLHMRTPLKMHPTRQCQNSPWFIARQSNKCQVIKPPRFVSAEYCILQRSSLYLDRRGEEEKLLPPWENYMNGMAWHAPNIAREYSISPSGGELLTPLNGKLGQFGVMSFKSLPQLQKMLGEIILSWL